jgi:dTDP-glucose pyrophosphorylase
VTRRAVVLARGLGTRMRAADPATVLTPEQSRAADAGLKAMMPVHARPFLDYVLSTLADSGIERVGLVVAPDHSALREYYERAAPATRLRLDYIVQTEALGTANAMLAAETWCGEEPFLALNSDNIYPTAVLKALAALDEPGLAVFARDALVRESNIPGARIRAFALLEIDADGYLAHIVEKPQHDLDSPHVSMNLWRFDSRIFGACRDIPRSRRGEYELPEAVGLAVSRAVRFRAVPATGPVLDLSTRADTADIERRLSGWTPVP